MSNDFKKPANALQSAQSSTEEEEFDFDIHFDKPIDPEHLEGAEDLHDFQVEHREEQEDYDFDTEDEQPQQEVDEDGEEEQEDYDFDTEDEQPEQEVDEDGEEEQEDYDFEDENSTLADDIGDIKGLSGVKMQSTQSLSQTQTQEENGYDFDEDDNDLDEDNIAQVENDSSDENFEEASDEEEYDFDEDFDEEIALEEDEPTSNIPEAIPTASKIAQMINSKKDVMQAKTPKINKVQPKQKKTFGNHIDLHRTKISLLAILIIISVLWVYASQIGVTTKSIPTFKDGIIKVIKADGVQMQYTVREKLIFHDAKTQITLNDLTKMEIDGTISLASGLFSNIQHRLNNSTLNIADATIKLTSTQNINILNTITELVNREFAQMFKGVSIIDTNVIVADSQGKPVVNLIIKKLDFVNTPQKSTITGTILTNSKPISVNYSYTPNGDLLDATLKSSAFNFNINGTQKTFGTATKDSQTKGKVEFVVKDVEEFVKIFGGNEKITNALAQLPQATMQADIDYSSLNHELNITNGKLSILNSVGTFSLKTTPDTYQAVVDFDNISVTEILERIMAKLAQTQQKPDLKTTKILNAKPEKKTEARPETSKVKTQGNVNKKHELGVFDIINPAKPIEIAVSLKNISAKSENLLTNMNANIIITRNKLEMKNLQVEVGNNIRLEADGVVGDINSVPFGVLNVAITGSGNYKNFITKTVEILTKLQISKEIKEETSVIKFSTLHKQPSTTINTIEIDIQDTISLTASTQLTENFTENNTPFVFKNITISNTNLNNLKIGGISIPQGSTVFQDVINNNAQNTSSTLNIVNSKLRELTINQATITKETQKDLVSHKIDINTTDFIIQNSTTINIQKSVPEFQSTTIIQNVSNMQNFQNILHGVFENNTILLPSFEKIDGKIYLIMLQTKIFNKPFERIEIIGNLNQGILEIPETKLVSNDANDTKPLSGKFSGTIDIRRSVPVFNLQATFVNAPMEEFKTILPFNANVGGTIFGGGSIEFSGTTYSELLETLKLKTKFVVQDASISNLNLDSVGQHLLKRQNNLESLNPEYIKNMFEQDGKTRANFIFSLTGESKKFSIEDCTIKTAYAGGACYGNVTVGNNSKAAVEIIAKFALPALDINNGLKDIMKLYISSKIKQEGETCEITNDFSQINKYTSYRKTTFSS